MSFFDAMEAGLEDAQEPKCVEAGEYEVRITGWKRTEDGDIIRSDSNGLPFIMPVLEVINCPDAEYAKPLTHFLRIPDSDNLDAKELNKAKWNMKCFFESFGVNMAQRIDFEELVGMQTEALLDVQPDQGYGEQNFVKKWMRQR